MSDEAPPSYFCPISMELMRYPVITTDGLCYDRAEIERWFAGGNSTSPLSGASLDSTALIPNIALRQAIEKWEETHSKVLQRSRKFVPRPELAAAQRVRHLLRRHANRRRLV